MYDDAEWNEIFNFEDYEDVLEAFRKQIEEGE